MPSNALAVPNLLNPYSVGGSLNDPQGVGFFGREDVLEFVASSLQTARRPPIVLYGQRRIGKSSVLRQLPRHLPPGTVCVYFDLQGQAALSLDAVLYGLAREIAGPCGLPRPVREDISSETFIAYLNRACAQLGSPRRLVLMFDEFDVIDVGVNTNIAASSFLGYLAALIERAPDVGIVIVAGRKVAELSETFTGAILRNAVHHRLVRLTRAQSDALATHLGLGTLEFGEEALASLYALTAGHPYCTQLLCNMIWQRLVRREVTLPAPVAPTDVEEALAPAVEYGTSGLNWIYDGLDVPSHRLFLAALAELQCERLGAPATMSEIEQRLLRYGMLIDAGELRSAPAKLANWDVVDNSPTGYRFAVPIIGYWIRLNRPLVELEAQARLANPRAWRFYELGALSQERSQFDEAIGLYQQAVAANPALIEALLRLGACYRARDGDGDLPRAIEAYERAHDLDAEAPRAALTEALGEQVDRNASDPVVQVAAFKRLAALDPEGPAAARARRRIQRLARLRLPLSKQLSAAELLFGVINDHEGLQAVAREQVALRPYKRVEDIGFGSFFLGVLMAVVLSYVPADRWFGWPASSLDWPRWIITGLAISGLAIGAQADTRSAPWRVTLLGASALSTTIAVAWGGANLFVAGFAGFLTSALASVWLTPSMELPAELRPSPRARSQRPLADLALRVAGALQRFAQSQEAKKR